MLTDVVLGVERRRDAQVLLAADAALGFGNEFGTTVRIELDGPSRRIEAVGVVVKEIDEQHAMLNKKMFFEKSSTNGRHFLGRRSCLCCGFLVESSIRCRRI